MFLFLLGLGCCTPHGRAVEGEPCKNPDTGEYACAYDVRNDEAVYACTDGTWQQIDPEEYGWGGHCYANEETCSADRDVDWVE